MKRPKSPRRNRRKEGRSSSPPPLPKQVYYPVGEEFSRIVDEAFAVQDEMERLEEMMKRGPFPAELLSKF